ncbi:MAG: endonuclease III [Bacteroidetes bacterium]|nr:endonuclease III [Bacteroidota bacterium]
MAQTKKVTKKPSSTKRAVDWNEALRPLLKKYRGRKHPLAYQNAYQLIVMIVLSARSSDAIVNNQAPALFAAYPDFNALSKAEPEALYPLIKGPGYRHKAEYIIGIAKDVAATGVIPEDIDRLTQWKGFGRKSANVYMSQMGLKAEGIIVDLHTLRVSPRLGIALSDDPKKMEAELMERIDRKQWHQAGMALTFLGRETCRPTDPHCDECLMNPVCGFYKKKKK